MAEQIAAAAPQVAGPNFDALLAELVGMLASEQGVSTADVNAEMERRAPAQTYQPPPMRVNFEPNRLSGERPMPSAPEIMTGIRAMPGLDISNPVAPGQGLQPQSATEANALARDAQSVGTLLQASGVAPAYRAGVAASEGRPIDAAGQAAVAMMPYRPLAALGALGAAYGGAFANDLGAFDPTTAMAQQPPAQADTLPPELKARREVLLKQLRRQGDNMPEALQNELAGINKIMTDAAMARINSSVDRDREASRSAQSEYDRSVIGAENALAEARGRVTRPFKETNVGRLYEATGGWTPAVVGAGTSALARAIGRNRLESVAEGTLAGALTPNAPLVWDLFSQPTYNPERRMYSDYARDLPPTHPRRQEWTTYAQGLPEENPARRLASDEFYDLLKFGERTGIGALEGLAGGLVGANLAGGARSAAGSIGSGLERMTGRRQGTPPPPASPAPQSPQSASPSPPDPGLAGLSTTLRQDRRPPLSTEPAPPRPTGLPQGYQEDSRLPSGVRGPRGRFARDPRKD